MKLTKNEWEIANQICTQKQLATLDLWRRAASYRNDDPRSHP